MNSTNVDDCNEALLIKIELIFKDEVLILLFDHVKFAVIAKKGNKSIKNRKKK